MQALVRARVAAGIWDDTEASCDARHKKGHAPYGAAREKIGAVRVWKTRTRFADEEASRGQTLEHVVEGCLFSCLIEEKGPAVRAEVLATCKQAKTALDDLAEDVKTKTD